MESTMERWPELAALVDELVDLRSQVAALHAREAIAYAGVLELALVRMQERRAADPGEPRSDLVLRSLSAEVGAALHLSDRGVQRRLGDASALVEDYPAVLDALRSGRIERGHAAVIVDAGVTVSAELRDRFVDRALDVAECESVPRTRAAVAAIAAAVDPVGAQAAITGARRDRAVRVHDLPDGMARVIADLPAPLAYAILDRLSSIGREVIDARASSPIADSDARPALTPRAAVAEATDGRTLDEVRADVFADVLLTATPTVHGDPEVVSSIAGRVQVTVPVLALAGATDDVALLSGYGPIDVDLVRQLAARAPGWDRVLVDAGSGLPLAVDRYRPSEQQRRYLAARDEHCRFPGCRMAVWRCDVDHTVDATYGGATDCTNLAHFCRRHHVMKHHTAWTVRQLPGGILEWTSPLGRVLLDRPAPTVRFVPDPSPPPF